MTSMTNAQSIVMCDSSQSQALYSNLKTVNDCENRLYRLD